MLDTLASIHYNHTAMQHPQKIKDLLFRQSARRRKPTEHKQAHRSEAGRKGGLNGSVDTKRKAGRKGGLTRQLNAYRKAGLMAHPNVKELLRQLETMH